MSDETRATEEEQEQGQDRIEAEEDMRGPNEPDPDLPAENPAPDDDA
ncbi:MAG: hypothetical protein H0T13_06255 [Actinobacteria bacterium]|nr:hypothetical protein [Actinomycetota bacterium]